MIFSEDIFIRIAIFVLGLCGFAVARHIYKHKNNNRNPLLCPIKFDCHTVVHSDYSKLMGVPVEILGMIYYSLVAVSYLFFIFIPNTIPVAVVNFMITISLIAFCFSVYLIGVQIFILKKGCSWCIVSAVISALIFALTVATYHWSYIIEILI